MDQTAVDPPCVSGSSGVLLRQARTAKGLDLDALAMSIKVNPRMLDALENGRYQELPDAGFTRALALALCRALSIDPAPVLAGLPSVSQGDGLEHVTRGLNQPFDPSRLQLGGLVGGRLGLVLRPQIAAPLALLMAAVLIYLLWPQRIGTSLTRQPAAPALASSEATSPVPASADGGNEPASVSSAASEATPRESAQSLSLRSADGLASGAVAAPSLTAASAAQTGASEPGGLSGSLGVAPVDASPGAAVLLAREASWLEVRDGRGRALVSRLIQPGERVVLEGAPPLRLKIGNASGVDLTVDGRAMDLRSHARDNVARLELP